MRSSHSLESSGRPGPRRRQRTIAFFHAHPDDEAIFTGGTIARLKAVGHRVVLLVATGGELGEPHPPQVHRERLGSIRRAETRRAAALLGIDNVHFLGFHDSGVAGDPANDAPTCLWSAAVEKVAAAVGAVLRDEDVDTLVVYDEFGIYGHPDHVAVHRAGRAAAADIGIETLYEATVNREYLHFVATHLVEEAIRSGDLGPGRSRLGVPSVLVSTTVDVRGVLEVKRAAMAAHSSQLPETSAALQLGFDHFADVYGFEWYVRHGPPGPIEMVAQGRAEAIAPPIVGSSMPARS